jgi:hypothetical protein
MRPQVTRAEIKVTLTMATVFLGLLLALALLAMPSAEAQPPREGPGGQGGVTATSTVPTMISYQGQLLDSSGKPVPDGTYSMTFKLYNVPTGGTSVWQETQSVTVTNGLFNVLLGSAGSPLSPTLFTGTTYLGVTVGSGQEMTPRQQIVSVPYAFQAKTDNDWDGAGTGKMYTHYLTDTVGIGTRDPQGLLQVGGETFIVTANNDVGIGTINPQTELHVVDTKKSTDPGNIDYWPNGILIESDSSVSYPNHSPRLGLVDTNPSLGGSVTTAPAWYIGNWADRFEIFRQPNIHSIGVDFLNIVNTGNVGIGTREPSEKLHVNGNIKATGNLIAGDGITIDGVNNKIEVSAPPDNNLRIMADSVGIGTTTPQKMLDIRPPQGGYTNLGIRLDPNNGTFVGGTAWQIDNNLGDFKITEAFPGSTNTRLIIPRGTGNVGIGTTSPGDYKLNVKGEKAGIYSVATVAANTPRPFAVVADLDISSGSANHGGGFEAAIDTAKVPATSIPYVLGGYFRMEDGGNTGLSQHLRGVTIDLLNTQQDDYGLELKVDNPSYAIYSSGTGTAYFAGNVGVGTDDPHTKLQVAGPVATAVRSVAASYTIAEDDSIVVITGVAPNVDITLPSPVGIDGRQYTIKNMSNSDVTVRTSVGVIESMPTYLLKGLLLGGVGKSITVVSDGARWLIISEIK